MTEGEPVAEATFPARSRLAAVRELLRRSAPFLLLYCFFLGLAVWCFAPAFDRLETAFIGKPGSDVLRNAWGFWWFKAMLFERLRVPAFTVYLNYPRGMLILVIDPLNCLLSLPLQFFFGLPGAYNLYLIAVVAFSGFAAALFARHLTGSMATGLVAGVLYGYAPYVLSNSLSGNSEVVNVGWLPLFLLFFHRALVEGRKRDGLLTGLMLICTTLSSWYYGYIAALFAALYGGIYLLIRAARRLPVKPSLRALAWSVLPFAVFTLTMVAIFHDIVPSVQKGASQGGQGQDPVTVLAGNGVSLWDMFSPTPERWHRPSLYHFPLEVLVALPFALLLGIRRSWSWMLIGVLALLLSFSFKTQWHPMELPPQLWPVWERITHISATVYSGFLHLPFSRMIRFPSRFLAIANLMVAVIAAFGLRTLFIDRPRLQPIWLCIGTLLSITLTQRILESARFHEIFEMTPVPVPEYVKQIAADPDWVAAVNLPTDLQGGLQLYYQTLHEKPLLNYVDFVTSRLYYVQGRMLPLSYSSALYGMHLRGYDDYMQGYPSEVPEWPDPVQLGDELERLRQAGLRYIIVERKKFKPESLAEFEALMKSHVTLQLSAEGVDLYRLK